MSRVETRAGKRKRERDANAGEALAGLPNHLVATHVFRYFEDPADLARLRVVSPGMRDAVNATGPEIKEIELDDYSAVNLGCLSALRRLQRRGLLTHKNFHFHFLCQSAARAGELEVLQWLHANGCPWDKETRAWAVSRGYYE